MRSLKHNTSKAMLLLTAFLTPACGSSSFTPPPVTPPNPIGDPGEPTQTIPDGVWIQKGFGRALDVTGASVQFYDYTRETCLVNSSLTQDELLSIIDIESVGDDGFIATEDSGTLVFSKRDTLPPACSDDRFISADGPVETLNHFIANFDDYYPFFEARGITDWNERVNAARMNVNDQTPDEALISELIGLLSGLDDFHVTLSVESEFEFSPGDPSGQLQDVLVTGFANQSDIEDVNEYVDLQLQQFQAIRNRYFDDGSLEMAGPDGEDIFLWATIGNGRIGYIEVSSMGGLDPENDLMATEELMDEILTDFANTDALILNVSINGGGDLSIADAIASRFTTQQLTVSSYEAISYDDSPMAQRIERVHRNLEPTERVSYSRPIATISGINSVSAAEHFLISMRALNHPVCFIGEPSDGILSAILEKPLPMGDLKLGMSNMIVYDHTGQSFETIGIPVDVEAVTFEIVDSETQGYQALDAALTALGFGYLIDSPDQAADCTFTDARTRFELSAP